MKHCGMAKKLYKVFFSAKPMFETKTIYVIRKRDVQGLERI